MFEALERCINATGDDLGFEACRRNPKLIEQARAEIAAARELIEAARQAYTYRGYENIEELAAAVLKCEAKSTNSGE